MSNTVLTDTLNRAWQHYCDLQYLRGRMKPNYPVPAIPNRVDIYHDMVVYWEFDDYGAIEGTDLAL